MPIGLAIDIGFENLSKSNNIRKTFLFFENTYDIVTLPNINVSITVAQLFMLWEVIPCHKILLKPQMNWEKTAQKQQQLKYRPTFNHPSQAFRKLYYPLVYLVF